MKNTQDNRVRLAKRVYRRANKVAQGFDAAYAAYQRVCFPESTTRSIDDYCIKRQARKGLSYRDRCALHRAHQRVFWTRQACKDVARYGSPATGCWLADCLETRAYHEALDALWQLERALMDRSRRTQA